MGISSHDGEAPLPRDGAGRADTIISENPLRNVIQPRSVIPGGDRYKPVWYWLYGSCMTRFMMTLEDVDLVLYAFEHRHTTILSYPKLRRQPAYPRRALLIAWSDCSIRWTSSWFRYGYSLSHHRHHTRKAMNFVTRNGTFRGHGNYFRIPRHPRPQLRQILLVKARPKYRIEDYPPTTPTNWMWRKWKSC